MKSIYKMEMGNPRVKILPLVMMLETRISLNDRTGVGRQSRSHPPSRLKIQSGQPRKRLDVEGSTTTHICRKTARRWQNTLRLQYTERKHYTLGASPTRWINTKTHTCFSIEGAHATIIFSHLHRRHLFKPPFWKKECQINY
jgi:hypothetical protein